jgi:hypothetical protein
MLYDLITSYNLIHKNYLNNKNYKYGLIKPKISRPHKINVQITKSIYTQLNNKSRKVLKKIIKYYNLMR